MDFLPSGSLGCLSKGLPQPCLVLSGKAYWQNVRARQVGAG